MRAVSRTDAPAPLAREAWRLGEEEGTAPRRNDVSTLALARQLRRRLRCRRVGHKWLYRRIRLTGDERVRRCIRCGRSENVDAAKRTLGAPGYSGQPR